MTAEQTRASVRRFFDQAVEGWLETDMKRFIDQLSDRG